MPGRDIVVIGASAGGVSALQQVVGGLPPDLPAAVFVVLHLRAGGTSMLARILDRAGPLSALNPQDGELITHGRVYVAAADTHLMVDDGVVRVVRGPRENGHRPAVDPLFRSAAQSYGARVIGVILTGALDDGSAGLRAVKAAGGVAVVQDPAEAYAPDMPRHALRATDVDYCVGIAEMPALIARLVREGLAPHTKRPIPSGQAQQSASDPAWPGEDSPLTCPICHGAIRTQRDGPMENYACRIGHRFSPAAFDAAQQDSLERALTAARRALLETAAVARRVAEWTGTGERGRGRFLERAAEAERHAQAIEHMIEQIATQPENVDPSGAV